MNTNKQFLETLTGSPIHCPSCAKEMSLMMPDSFRRVLSQKGRDAIQSLLDGSIRVLMDFERILGFYNEVGVSIPVLDNIDVFSTREIEITKSDKDGRITSDIFDSLLTKNDVFELRSKLFDDDGRKIFPFHDKAVETRTALGIKTGLFINNDNIDNVLRFLLRAYMLPSKGGKLIPQIISSQQYFVDWLAGVKKSNDATKNLFVLLQHASPNLYYYINSVIGFLLNKSTTRVADQVAYKDYLLENKYSKDLNLEDSSLIEDLEATAFYFSIFLGHVAEEKDDTVGQTGKNVRGLSSGLLRKGDGGRFQFPKYTVIPTIIFDQFLGTKAIYDDGLIPFSDRPSWKKLREWDPKNKAEVKLQEFESDLNSDIENLFNFQCTGEVPGNFRFEESDSKEEVVGDYFDIVTDNSPKKICLWSPSGVLTFPIVLLGSPGTGKTSAMLTGLPSAFDHISFYGLDFHPGTPRDIELRKQLLDYCNAGRKPAPTPSTERVVIFGKVHDNFKHQSVNFAFVDIAGERVSRMIKEEGQDSVLSNILGKSKIVIFFFDIALDDDISAFLLDSRHGMSHYWEGRIPKHQQMISSPRTLNGIDKTKVSQFDLLNTIISEIKKQKGIGEDDKIDDVKFICVIPKADLFVAEKLRAKPDVQNKVFFLTDFFEKLLEFEIPNSDKKISFFEHTEHEYKGKEDSIKEYSFQELYSLGGVTQSLNGIDEIPRREKFIEIMKKLSDLFEETVITGIGNAVSSKPSEDEKAISLSALIKNKLFQKLKAYFW